MHFAQIMCSADNKRTRIGTEPVVRHESWYYLPPWGFLVFQGRPIIYIRPQLGPVGSESIGRVGNPSRLGAFTQMAGIKRLEVPRGLV
jgi:hypothetical protein